MSWDGPIVRQSEELEKYQNILSNFKNELGLFECFCSRKDIKLALSAPHVGDNLLGPDGLIYPGTCRENIVSSKINFKNVLRMKVDLDEEKIFTFNELGQKKGKISFTSSEFLKTIGDVVLWRKSYPAYHLACVIDDAQQKITHVVRGMDLFEATKIHTVLNTYFGFHKPFYYHHKLICDENGTRLAKRDDSKSIQKYRLEGFKPSEVRAMIGF